MPVTEANLKLYGSQYMPDNDTDINGGAIDVNNELTGVLGEVFTDLYSDEEGGNNVVQYRKVFFRNESTSDLLDAKIWISSDPLNQIKIALEPVKGGSDTSANRVTAPEGYTFVDAPDEANALVVPNGGLLAGENIGVWLEITIPPGLSPVNSVTAKIKIKGKTTA